MLLQILFFVVILALLGVLVWQAREQRSVVVGLAVLIAFLPLGDIPLAENFRILGTAIMAVLIVCSFALNKSRQFTWQPIFYAIVGVYLLSIVGLLHSGCLSFANKRIDVSSPMIIFPVLFSMVQLSKRNVMLLLRFFVWIVILVCIYGLLSYAITVYEFSLKAALSDGKRFSHFFMVFPLAWHPSAFVIALLMALPVSLYLRYHDGKQITLVEMLLAILLPILVTFMVGARIGVAVFPVLLGLGYFVYCKFKPTLKWGLAASGVVAGLCVLFFVIPPDMKNHFSDQLRLDQRNIAISAIQEKPILGWGTWTQHDLMSCEERRERVGAKTSQVFSHFHNQYLDAMVQFGIIGIAALLFLIGWIFWIAIRKKHFLLLSFMAMYVIVFYFDNVLHSINWVHVFMFWLCFLLASQNHLVERKTQ